jgi:hypothetical protein
MTLMKLANTASACLPLLVAVLSAACAQTQSLDDHASDTSALQDTQSRNTTKHAGRVLRTEPSTKATKSPPFSGQQNKIQRTGDGAQSKGHRPARSSEDLMSGESETYRAYFFAGEDIWATCEQRGRRRSCEDIDIYLYHGKTGELVASDTLLDNQPVVTAPHEGWFFVEVVMVTCSNDLALEGCVTYTDSDEGF